MNKTKTPLRKRNTPKTKATASKKSLAAGRARNGNGNGSTNGRTNNHNGNGHTVTSAPAVKTGVVVAGREQLLQEKAHIEAELSRLRAELLETPEATGDEVDLSVYDREKTLGLIKAFETRLEKLDNALRAAESGQYGKCQVCGQPIDAERLKIFPETRHCIKCKTAQEREAKRMMQYK